VGGDPEEVPTTVLLGSFPVGAEGGLHALIRDARQGQPAALEVVLRAVAAAADHVWPEIGRGLVYPVPGHLAGGFSPLVRAAAEIIARRRGWELDLDGLVRLRPSPEAKLGGPRDPEAEAQTLWVRPRASTFRQAPQTIVLVDDIVRSGASLIACAEAVRRSGVDGRVVAAAISRASVRAREPAPRGGPSSARPQAAGRPGDP